MLPSTLRARSQISRAMPTVLRFGPYRFFFYSSEGDEPRHVHAQRDDRVAKFWLEPLRLESTKRFSTPELRRLRRIIERHHRVLIRRWDEYFDR